MSTKDEVLQTAIVQLINSNQPQAIDIATFNYYFRKFGSPQGNILSMACGAADCMRREFKNKVFELQEKPTFFNH